MGFLLEVVITVLNFNKKVNKDKGEDEVLLLPI
jgi:hypothetical protein